MSKHHNSYGTLQGGIGQTLCSFEHVSCCYSTLQSLDLYAPHRKNADADVHCLAISLVYLIAVSLC